MGSSTDPEPKSCLNPSIFEFPLTRLLSSDLATKIPRPWRSQTVLRAVGASSSWSFCHGPLRPKPPSILVSLSLDSCSRPSARARTPPLEAQVRRVPFQGHHYAWGVGCCSTCHLPGCGATWKELLRGYEANPAIDLSFWQTNGLCSDFCREQNKAFAIVQWQSCWCSDVAPDPSTEADVTEKCNGICPGYDTEKCGARPNYYGYIALLKPPTSTAGGGGGGAATTKAPSTTQVSIPPLSCRFVKSMRDPS